MFAGLIFGSETLLGEAPRWAATLTAAATVISLLLGIIAFANRRYRTAPTSVAVVRLMSQSEAWLKWRFLGNILQAIAINEAKLRWKTRFLSISLIAFLVAVTSAGGWFIYAIIGGTV